AVQPGKAGAEAPSASRHQDVDSVVNGGSAPDAVVHQGHWAGDEAARSAVEQRGHLLLRKARHAGRSKVDAGQQRLPRATPPDAVLHSVVLHAENEQLSAADDGELLLQELAQAAAR